MNNQSIIVRAKQLYYSGYSAYVIAKELNVSSSAVYYWIKKNFKLKSRSCIKNWRQVGLNTIIDYLNKDDNFIHKNYTQWADELGISAYSLHIAAYNLEIIDGKVVKIDGKLRGERLKTKPYIVSGKKGIMDNIKELILKGLSRAEIMEQIDCSYGSYYVAKSELKRLGRKNTTIDLSKVSNKNYFTEDTNPNSIQNIRKRQLVDFLNADKTLTNQDLAKKLNISLTTVRNYLRALSDEYNFGERQSIRKMNNERKQANKARLDELIKQDPSLTYHKLAKLTGLSITSVRNYILELEEERIFGA